MNTLTKFDRMGFPCMGFDGGGGGVKALTLSDRMALVTLEGCVQGCDCHVPLHCQEQDI